MRSSSRWLGPVAVGYLILPFVLLTVALVNFHSGAQTIPTQLPPSEFDARLVALDKEAIEAAYREHVQRMYSGWMKDDTGQPTRALTGVRQAQRAYLASMEAIKRREEELRRR